MLNKIVLMGRLTRDPELRQTQSGNSVVSFTLACDRDFAAQGAEKETDFVDIVAWRGTAEFVSKYFSKGRMAVVSGRLQIRNWEDKDGNKRKNGRDRRRKRLFRRQQAGRAECFCRCTGLFGVQAAAEHNAGSVLCAGYAADGDRRRKRASALRADGWEIKRNTSSCG